MDQWCKDVLNANPSIDSLRFLMTAYAFACHYGEETEKNAAEDVHRLLQFSNSTVYSKLMMFVLKARLSFVRTS